MNKDTSISSYILGWFSILFGSLTLNDWAVVIGMFATIMGLIITWYYKHAEFKLKARQVKNDESISEK